MITTSTIHLVKVHQTAVMDTRPDSHNEIIYLQSYEILRSRVVGLAYRNRALDIIRNQLFLRKLPRMGNGVRWQSFYYHGISDADLQRNVVFFDGIRQELEERAKSLNCWKKFFQKIGLR